MLTAKISRWIRRGIRREPARVPTETTTGFCQVCGEHATFASFEPVETPCKRNTFLCGGCGASARNRHVAQVILDRFPNPQSPSLREFGRRFGGTIWQTATYGAIADALRAARGFTGTEFIDNTPSGQIVNGVRCEDIQATSFGDASIDLVITEDVLEHVPDPAAAFAEIRRVLKAGGFHVGTIPVNWTRTESVPRAILENGSVRHLLPPDYHFDPTTGRESALAFTDFGHDIVTRYCAIIGTSWMLAANGDAQQERDFAIYNSWVFVSQKAEAAPSP